MKKENIKHSFISDNASCAHPLVVDHLSQINSENVEAYGNDEITKKVKKIFKQQFGEETACFFTFNGTASNVVALKAMCRTYETIYCSTCAHLHIDEAGATENYLGAKVIPVETTDGKINISDLKKHVLENRGNVHRSQPRVISLTQATERGTLYSKEEIKEITDFAKEFNLFVHMDGARIANAAVALKKSFKEISADLGVDILSFGGTKNGLMFGEAIVVINPYFIESLPFIHKQAMQLCSKNRFIAAQFEAYFENDLWEKNASNANQMASYLAQELRKIPEVKICSPVEVNTVFATMPRAWIYPLKEDFSFYLWSEENCEIRLVTSFNTSKGQIDAFIDKMIKNKYL